MLGKTPLRANPLAFWLYVEALASLCFTLGVTKRCRLSWLTNSALLYEPKCGGGGGSANEDSCAHGAEINFGELSPYLIYGFTPLERNHPFILH